MNNEPVSHQYDSVLERMVVGQVAEIEELKNEIKEFEAEKQKDFERKW